MKSKMLCNMFACVMTAIVVSSCEKMALQESAESEANVVLRISQFEQTPFPQRTRTAEAAEVCTKLNFLVYKDGTRIRQENQTIDDVGFGEARFMLPEGRYYLVVLAHSSENPTTTNAERISFTDAKGYTDTFLYSDSLIVGDSDVSREIELKRIVSMVRFVFDDPLPTAADYVKFQYKGGSRALNAMNYGCGLTTSTYSTQITWFTLNHSEKKFEFYTIPQTEGSNIDVTVTSHHGSKNDSDIISTREIKGIPVKRNKITTCYGSLFNPVYGSTFKIKIDDDWDGDSLTCFF